MARRIFNAGKARGQILPARPTASSLPQQVAQQISRTTKAAGMPTSLFTDRQNNFTRRSQTWVWDASGNV